MGCIPPRELTRFLANQFTDDEARALDDHLAGCASCRAALDALSRDPALDALFDAHRDVAEGAVSTTSETDHATADGQFLRQLRRMTSETLASSRHAPPSGWTGRSDGALVDEMPPAPPRIPGLDIGGMLGRGGMGIVYEAYDTQLRRRVALKVISRERAPAEMMARIRLEAQAAARLNHPHVVQIYAVGENDGQPYVLLEYVGGGTLADRLQGRPRAPREGATLVAKLARAVQFAHERHVIHRDLKPRNVLLEDNGLPADAPLSAVTPKITDFGLAKLLDSEMQATRADQILGTPAYAAPEQLNPALGAIGPTTDVYSLGAILYEVLTGRPPLQAEDIWRTMQLVLHSDPVPPRQLQPGIPADLETICLHCLVKDAARRYASAAELADDLDRFLADQPIRARPISPMERLFRWSRRNRALSGALAVVALLLTATAVTSTIAAGYLRNLSRKLHATVNDLTARTSELTEARNKARDDAAENLRLARAAEAARQAADNTTYFSRIALAYRAWESADLLSARQLLDKCQPSAGQPDRRAWEWRYLNQLCQTEVLNIDAQRGHTSQYFFGIAYSPDGRWLATGSTELKVGGKSDVTVWDTSDYRFARRGEVPVEFPAGLRFRADGRQLAVLDRDGHAAFVCRFDESQQFAASPTEIEPGSFDSADPVVAVINREQEPAPTATLHDRSTGQTLRTLSQPGGVRSVAVSHDGRRAVTLGDDLSLRVWDLGGESAPRILNGHLYSLSSAAFHPQRNQLASAGLDRTIRIWDLTRAQRQLDVQVPSTLTHGERLIDFDFAADGRELVAVEHHEQALRVGRAEVATGEIRDERRVEILQITANSLHAVAVSGEARRIVAPLRDHESEVAIYDLDAGRMLHRLVDPSGPIVRAAISGDGRRVATTGFRDSGVLLWDASTGRIARTFSPPGEFQAPKLPPVPAFSPRGDYLAVGHDGMTGVHVWNVESGTHVCHVRFDEAWEISGLSFRSDSRQLAIVSERTNRIAVYDIPSGKLRYELSGPASVQSVAFSPTEHRLAAVGRQGSVYLWDSESGELILNLARSRATRGNYGYGALVKWSPDGRRLAANNWLGRIDVWEAPDRRSEAAERLAVADTRSTLWFIREAQSVADRTLARQYAEIVGDRPVSSPHTRAERGFMWAKFEQWERAANDLFPLDDGAPRALRWQIAQRVGASPELLRELVELRPDVPELLVVRADAAERDGDAQQARGLRERAVAMFEQAFAARPDDPFLARRLTESLLARDQPQWRTLRTRYAVSAAHATLAVQDDGSILATGPDVPGDKYAVIADSDVARIAAIRLEALPHDSLPSSGPGRHTSGNFQLARLRLQWFPKDAGAAPEPIPLREAWASYQWPADVVDVRDTIRDDGRKVWHVWSRFGTPHFALFIPHTPVTLAAGQGLITELEHFDQFAVNLGRFRLSVCDHDDALTHEWNRRLLNDVDVAEHSALAAALVSAGEVDQARQLLASPPFAASPSDDGLRQLLAARIHRRQGRVDDARQAYDRLIEWLRDRRLPSAYSALTADSLDRERASLSE